MMRLIPGRRSVAVLVAAMTIAVTWLPAPPPASAHGDPTVVVRLREVRPAFPDGVQLKVIDGEATLLALANPSATPMFALDPEDKPFLRVSADGVFGDVDSPYLRPAIGAVKAATPAHLKCCEGRWMRLSGKSGWAWPDPRLDPPLRGDSGSVGSDRGLGSLQESRPLATWEVSFRYGSRTLTSEGVVERRQFLGRLRTTVDAVPRDLTVNVIEGSLPQLRLVIPSGTRVEVLGSDGRTFLRMTPDGTYARAESKEYRTHRRAIGLPPAAEAGWVPMGESTKVAWADIRLGYSGRLPAEAETRSRELAHWRIPVVVNGKPGEIDGTLRWEPMKPPDIEAPTARADDSNGTVPYIVAALLTVALAAAYGLARRRAATNGERDEPDSRMCR